MATAEQLRLRPYMPGDFEWFEPRADFVADMAADDWDWSKGPPRGRVWTLQRGEVQVLGVAGIGRVDADWHAWAILADIPPKVFVRALWLAQRQLDLFERMEAGGLYSFSRRENPAAQRCLEHIGFRRVGHTASHAILCRRER